MNEGLGVMNAPFFWMNESLGLRINRHKKRAGQ